MKDPGNDNYTDEYFSGAQITLFPIWSSKNNWVLLERTLCFNTKLYYYVYFFHKGDVKGRRKSLVGAETSSDYLFLRWWKTFCTILLRLRQLGFVTVDVSLKKLCRQPRQYEFSLLIIAGFYSLYLKTETLQTVCFQLLSCYK